ncbi:DJ-1/PfpI family protein [Levilactobacillus spicheri]|uniref:4-methyl-5(B-hydroxyethyl)-thiazole monophosphate biosynthesis protein n=2 Tax=Levilactobacillus spicheri TaxID=216463 RepID=A0ABQ0WNQ2_9LACO|nr:DJ-1/PfpI family protein [Levilactobacillus spicheri]KRL46992.1 4-methyl-5(B-hydroxyethyl)-thiazole monophosphate biosynthesis protein [Levilactobacillus spicheri DSM 15429]GEO66628.1 4-methyl-5(B-hydroxyethyl)-thiazole monophosphate biosynthesis protein [Levilactobacillus spicheri]
MKKFLVMLYPGFCYFEVSALVEALAFEKDWTMTTVGAERRLYESEEHLQVMAQTDFSQVDPLKASLIILPGIDNYHVPLDDERNVAFLRRLDTVHRPVIAAMSSSPVLLAKAGLLTQTHFTGGIFEETYAKNPFIPKQNLQRQPVVIDNGIVTSSFQFFREFAIATLRTCGLKIGETAFAPARTDRSYTADELTYHYSED